MEWSKKEIKKYYWAVVKYHFKDIVIMCYLLPVIVFAFWLSIVDGGKAWIFFLSACFGGFVMVFVFGLGAISSLTDVKYRNLMKIDIQIYAIERIMPKTVAESKLWIMYPFPDKKYILYAENGDVYFAKEKIGRNYNFRQFILPMRVRLVYCRESKIVVSMIVEGKDFV